MRRALPLALLTLTLGCDGLRAVVIDNYPTAYSAEAGAAVRRTTPGAIDGPDLARLQLSAPVALAEVVTGLNQPTDIQFPPGRSDVMVVLQKDGRARRFSIHGPVQDLGDLFVLAVPTRSEQGLLGLAFHPRFGPTGGDIFVNHIVEDDGKDKDRTRVSRMTVQIEGERWTAGPPTIVLEQAQPYANHNAGQLAFGPDGMLYVGFGDGGWRDDPHGEGQDASGWLGSMLRIDVDNALPYAIPKDNPFLDSEGVAPETWAVGLRNPWRYTFAPDGRLVVADVGQNLWEEVSIVSAGSNLGWNIREGRHCFGTESRCPEPAAGGMTDPFWEYGHGQDGASITGGPVYEGTAIPELQGRYIVGDFVSGRIWALPLPGDTKASPALVKATALGHWKLLISTFGKSSDGEIYVADYNGAVHKLVLAP